MGELQLLSPGSCGGYFLEAGLVEKLEEAKSRMVGLPAKQRDVGTVIDALYLKYRRTPWRMEGLEVSSRSLLERG